MTYDPFQINPTLGAYSGVTTNPFISSPLTAALQTSLLNPAAISQLGQQGIQTYGGINPQQLQLAALLTSQAMQTPWGQQSPLLQQNPFAPQSIYGPFYGPQNPITQLQNPLLQAALQTPGIIGSILQNPFTQQSIYGQNPFTQLQNPLLQAALQTPGVIGSVLQNPLLQAALQTPGVIGSVLQNPLLMATLQNPVLQNPVLQATLQNPLLQHTGLHNPIHALTGQVGSPFGQIGQLAPQTWVGQPGLLGQGLGQTIGQIHPLIAQQLAVRAALQASGVTPWMGV